MRAMMMHRTRGEADAACRSAKLGRYVIEGYVSARENHRLLEERPDAAGLAVSGMPISSPGMDSRARGKGYAVLLVNRDGSTDMYATYAATE